jgi:glycerol kinase
MEILRTQVAALRDAFYGSGISPAEVAAIGIANQRETVVLWEKDTGRPVYPAVSWQCRRSAELCDRMKADGLSDYVSEHTGLLIDAYFSGTKIKWILDAVPGLRARAQRGELLCGTVDSWLIWNLTGGTHVTDCSNASRTLLFDIHSLAWDERLCSYLGVPPCLLPKPLPSDGNIRTDRKRAAAIWRIWRAFPSAAPSGISRRPSSATPVSCPAEAKNTYGTGCFALLNTGARPVCSAGGLLASVGWVLAGKPVYVLEGSVFNAGSAIQWLRDGLGLIKTAHECDVLAQRAGDNGGVYFVPAFTGLGAPYWDMYARGTMAGLTRAARGSISPGRAGEHRVPGDRPGASHERERRD